MEFLEKFKAIHCYDSNGRMMTQEELEPLGLAGNFMSPLTSRRIIPLTSYPMIGLRITQIGMMS